MASPSNFVLVHGAWGGGWIWRRVADRLQARGRRVFTPTLTGLADRSHLLSPKVNLSTHILDVVNLMKWEELDGVVLVGHSYGGMVITGVTAEAEPGTIASIVYLDAFLPDDGKSLIDYAPMPNAVQRGTEIPLDADQLVPPIPASAPRMNAADVDWLNRQRTWQPMATFKEPVRRTERLERIPMKTYVLATGYDNVTHKVFAEKVKDDPAWRYIELPGSHDLMLSMPEETANLLLAAAN